MDAGATHPPGPTLGKFCCCCIRLCCNGRAAHTSANRLLKSLALYQSTPGRCDHTDNRDRYKLIDDATVRRAWKISCVCLFLTRPRRATRGVRMARSPVAGILLPKISPLSPLIAVKARSRLQAESLRSHAGLFAMPASK